MLPPSPNEAVTALLLCWCDSALQYVEIYGHTNKAATPIATLTKQQHHSLWDLDEDGHLSPPKLQLHALYCTTLQCRIHYSLCDLDEDGRLPRVGGGRHHPVSRSRASTFSASASAPSSVQHSTQAHRRCPIFETHLCPSHSSSHVHGGPYALNGHLQVATAVTSEAPGDKWETAVIALGRLHCTGGTRPGCFLRPYLLVPAQ